MPRRAYGLRGEDDDNEKACGEEMGGAPPASVERMVLR